MRIVLADEISPDSCRLWDMQTNEKLDKDRFRRDLGGVVEAYSEVAKRWASCRNRCKARTRGRFSSNRALWPTASHLESRMKARVLVTLKNGVLDPQGKAIGHALAGLGFSGVGEVRQAR